MGYMVESGTNWVEKVNQSLPDHRRASQVINRYVTAYHEPVDPWEYLSNRQAIQERIAATQACLPEFVLAVEDLRLAGDTSTRRAFARLEGIKREALREFIPDAHRAQTLKDLTDPRRFSEYETDRFPHFARFLAVYGEPIPASVFRDTYMTGLELRVVEELRNFERYRQIAEGPLTAIPSFARGLKDFGSPMSIVYAKYKELTMPS